MFPLHFNKLIKITSNQQYKKKKNRQKKFTLKFHLNYKFTNYLEINYNLS